MLPSRRFAFLLAPTNSYLKENSKIVYVPWYFSAAKLFVCTAASSSSYERCEDLGEEGIIDPSIHFPLSCSVGTVDSPPPLLYWMTSRVKGSSFEVNHSRLNTIHPAPAIANVEMSGDISLGNAYKWLRSEFLGTCGLWAHHTSVVPPSACSASRASHSDLKILELSFLTILAGWSPRGLASVAWPECLPSGVSNLAKPRGTGHFVFTDRLGV
eukprot:Gb_24575 [translate_table: standard]